MKPENNGVSVTAGEVQRKETSARLVIERALERCLALDKTMNIFTSLDGDHALGQADQVDCSLQNGAALPLAGIPLAVKDDFSYSGLPAGFGSPALAGTVPPYSAAAVMRLIAAGAVVMGKTNLGPMSMGSTTAASPAGPTLDPARPGQAAFSAGAVVVAAGGCSLALESDSGGALRQGAARHGIFGLRPSAGLVSREGLFCHSPSFAQVGLSATHCADILPALRVLAGFDENDAATGVCSAVDTSFAAGPPPGKPRIGYSPALLSAVSPAGQDLGEDCRETLESRGFSLVELELPLFPEALRAYYVIASVEASSSLARFDGIRFGRPVEAATLDELYALARRDALGPEARRRSVFGALLLGDDRHRFLYQQALRVRQLIGEVFASALQRCDLVLLPLFAVHPGRDENDEHWLDHYEGDLFCAPVSMAGLPALSLPPGEPAGLPAALQLVGPSFSEETLLWTGSLLEGFAPAGSGKGGAGE